MFRLFSFLCVILFWSDIYTSNAKKLLKGSAEANKIIAAHKKARNDIRNCKSYAKNGIMPKPSNMKYMSYDNQMAQSAEEWGNEACRRGIKSCTHYNNWKNSMNIQVGENLGCSASLGYIDNFMKQMIDDERAKYTFTGTSKGLCNGQANNKCGHYTQIIWSSSNKVGCAVNTCSNMLICHYSGPGNYPTTPYKPVSGSCGSNSGGGGSNTGGGGSTSGSAKCCECKGSPSKAKCGSTCENAVKAKDSWCGQNNWDGTCKNHAINFAKGCSGSSGGSTGGNTNGGSGGVCCGCKNNPSKATCGYKCENYVHGKDPWCKSNTWDGTCKNLAKKKCSGGFTFVGDCGGSDEAVCMGSTLWSDDYNATHRFEVDKNQCIDDQPVYNYTAYNEYHRSDMLYNLKSQADQWVLTVRDMKVFENETVEEIVAAICDHKDLKECTKYEWEIKYEEAAAYLRDNFMAHELEVRDGDVACAAEMVVVEDTMDAGSIAGVVIGAVIVLLVIGIAVYFLVYRKKNKATKDGKELEAIRDDDGCEVDGNEAEETIMVETEALN